MSTLSDLVGSRTRSEILRLLFGVAEREMHVRELERESGMRISTVRQELRKLAGLELIKARKDGNRLCYSANQAHPLYPDLCRIVLKTSGLVEVLTSALGTEKIRAAFVFGSLAYGTQGARSDVDLMVVGGITLREITRRLAGVTETIGREINPHTFTVKEFRERLDRKDDFLSRVMDAEKIFIVGTEDELGRMG